MRDEDVSGPVAESGLEQAGAPGPDATEESMYPEHDKQREVIPQSQVIGEFLDWLKNEQHVMLMVWTPTEFEAMCPGGVGFVRGPGGGDHSQCQRCHGTDRITLTREDWTPDRRTIEQLLAEFFEIDLTKIDIESRMMLDVIRSRQESI